MKTSQIITLLTGNNWESWKHEVKVLLLHYGAWEFMEKPDEGKVDKSLTKTKETAPGVTVKDELTWKEKQNIKLRKNCAYTIIYQSLSSEFRPLILSTTDGAKAWKILHDHFEPATRARVIQLLHVFFLIHGTLLVKI